MTYRLIHGRVERFTEHYHGPLFHGFISDTPYNLESITKRFGGKNAAAAQEGTDGAFQRISKGFMNKEWDTDIAFRKETWAGIAKCLYSGAFGFAFSSTRTFHRMMVAIEDAGLIIHPTIFLWAFGSGFPKATQVQAKGFEGHRYGGQALKPAVEPIVCFQKPYDGSPRQNIVATGAGALNIDAGRIPGAAWERSTPWKNDIRGGNYVNSQGHTVDCDPQEMPAGGRWPANFALVHSPDCTPARCVSECPARKLGEQSGTSKAGSSLSGNEPSQPTSKGIYNGYTRQAYDSYEDTGTASRYFYNADWSYEVREQLDLADTVRYEPKASTRERGLGLEHLRTQKVNDGRDTPIDNAYQRGETERLNPHPSVKPLALVKWLAGLLLPPAAYAPRRILVPFAGSGSEMIGALLAGWDETVGVEMEAEYIPVANARLKYWATLPVQPTLFDEF